MFELEILEAIRAAASGADRLNGIVDEFRRGRDVAEVGAILQSGDSELLSIGAWILSELPIELYNNSESMIARLRELLDHPAAPVRFHALGALYPALDWSRPESQALLYKLLQDPNEGVRRCAEKVASQLS
jgi:hypothetical protein